MSAERRIEVNGTEACLQGQGDETVLMLHGWPDTLALWDGTVAALQDRFVCVRLTLPGFQSGPSVTGLDAMCDLLLAVADRVSPGKPVILMLHDWGCFFGYQFAMRHPSRVSRVVGVDIGDHNSAALMRSWGVKEKLAVAGYQLWLAVAWLVGRRLSESMGTRMTRAMARWLRCPTEPELMTYKMNYPMPCNGLALRGASGKRRKSNCPCPFCMCMANANPSCFIRLRG